MHIKAIPSTNTGSEKNGLREALRKKTEECWFTRSLKITQQIIQTSRPKIQIFPELHQNSCGQQGKGDETAGETLPRVLHPALSTTQRHQPVGVSPEESHEHDQRDGVTLPGELGYSASGREDFQKKSCLPVAKQGLQKTWSWTKRNN